MSAHREAVRAITSGLKKARLRCAVQETGDGCRVVLPVPDAGDPGRRVLRGRVAVLLDEDERRFTMVDETRVTFADEQADTWERGHRVGDDWDTVHDVVRAVLARRGFTERHSGLSAAALTVAGLGVLLVITLLAYVVWTWTQV